MTEPTAHDALKDYGRLREAIAPLRELARNNPHTIESVIELAMLMGIHAAYAREINDERNKVVETVRQDLERAMWRGF